MFFASCFMAKQQAKLSGGKPVMTDQHSPTGFKKTLSTIDSYALGFGAMIGFAWVLLTGDWVKQAGTFGAALAMLIGGLIMAVVALVYGELTAAMPKAGGEHHYLMRSMGPRWAFIGSWGITGGYIAIVAFESVALPSTVASLWPAIKDNPIYTVYESNITLSWLIVSVIAAVAIAAINYFGIKLAGVIQTFVVIFLLVVGLLLVTGSFAQGNTDHFAPLFTDMSGFFSVFLVVPFMFVGFDVIPQAAEELNVPYRKIGRIIVITVLMAAVWYVMAILTTSSSMDHGALYQVELATAGAMEALWGSPVMGKVLLAAGLAGIITSWIALGGGR